MLQEISLSNFRLFDETVSLRVRPITILIGRNSAGKSTLIKFLLMLQQSLRASSADFLVSEGDRVHLGAFSDLKNSNTTKRSLEYELVYETRDLPSPTEREMMKSMQEAMPQTDPKTKRTVFHFSVTKQPMQTVVIESATAKVKGSVTYGRSQRGLHEVVVSSSDVVLHKDTTKNLKSSSFLRFQRQANDPREAMARLLADRFLAPIRYELRAMRHLSAIREESQRAIIASSPPVDDVGQRGQYAMPHLQEILANGGDDASFVTKHIEAVAEIESVKFQSSMKGYLAHCRAVNKNTGAEAYLADFGFGVSQCIPIFVQGAIMPHSPNHLLLVEQPEAQLHPTAQLEMGSFFADLWKLRHVPSMIETHSSNIIMRIRRLVANGTLAPSDVSIAYVCVKKKMPIILNLDIDREGNLEKGLPMQFFGQDIIEGMELGAAR